MTSRMLIAAAALLAPLPALAQTPVVAPAPATPELEVARRVMNKLFPDGIYLQLLGDGMNQMMGAVYGSVGDMPIGELARLGGIGRGDAEALGKAKLGEILAIYDPHWNERMRLSQAAMFKAMGELFGQMEPRIREGMARAYVREFTAAELTELDRFLSTPAGSHYARKSMLIAMDPEVVKEMSAVMPLVMERMPDMMKAVQKATAGLPPERKMDELTPADRKRLAELFGVPEDQLGDPDPEDENQQSEDPVQ